ncbi:MAG: polysaccharide pyruvyl transferase CsaB [Clostridia bacterium]
MKVMHLAGGGDIGGAKTHIISLASELSRTNQVKLISFRYGEFAKSAKEAGIDVVEIKHRFLPHDIKQLYEIYDEFKPDIVHCHGAKANLMGLFLKKHRNACVTTTMHSDYRKDYMHNIFKQITLGTFNTFALKIIRYHIAVTEEFARTLIGRGYLAYNMFSIYNGIDFEKPVSAVSRKSYLESYDIPYDKDDVIVGIAARLTKVKDVQTLIRGFAEAYKKAPSLRLMIAGEGEDKKSLINLCETLGVSQRVHFIGWITDVDSFFSSIDIDVISSLSETFPYSLTEGIRAGAIPISSNVGGASSLIENNVTGYIFEPKDHVTLAQYLAEIAADREKREQMQKAVYAHTKANFSLEAMRQRQEKIYTLIRKRFNETGRNGVIICGAYGKGNAGDDAIKYTTIEKMREIDDDMNICVMTLRPKKERAIDRVQTMYTFNVLKLLRELKRSKLFVSGGGSLIQDVTSSRSLYFYLFTLYLAKKLGCKVIMFGCGIGPVSRPINRWLSGKVIDRYVDVITVRDNVSKEELQSLEVKKPAIFLSSDPAINLMAREDDTRKIFVSENIPYSGRYLCVALRSWKDFSRYSDIAAACKYAYDRYGLTPVFLPMEYPKDLSISEKVQEYMQTPCYILHKRYPTNQTIAFISKMDLVIAMRLHALIFAAANYVPVVGLSYDMKVTGFMECIENPACLELDDVTEDALKNAIDQSFDKYDSVRKATDVMKKQEAVNKQQLTLLLK